MPYRDFREFLAALRERDRVVEVERYVDLDLDVGRALRRAYEAGGPAVVFRNTGKEFPLVAGVYSTRAKSLLAFQATEQTIFDTILRGLANPVAPVPIRGDAPSQEVVLQGDAVDIGRFPVPRYSPDDGGPYLTAGIVCSRDPETGVTDLGHYRFQVLGRDRLGFLAQPFHRFGKHIAKARAMGLDHYEAAIAIGTDPVLAYTCQVQLPDGTDDLSVAGGLRGAPVETVHGLTVDVDVPATAEVIIELHVDLRETAMEGPLGEYTGYYTPASAKPVAHITAITHRRGALFQGLLTGKPVTENHVLKQVTFEASLYRALKAQFPTVQDVAVPPSGGVSFYTVISMTPRYEGEARHVILAAMASNTRPKLVVVVEPDIDVHKSSDVEWALCFRAQPARDAVVVEGLPAGPLDPSVDDAAGLAGRSMSALGIDATRPFGRPFPKVADVPGWREFAFPELDAAAEGGSQPEPPPRRAPAALTQAPV